MKKIQLQKAVVGNKINLSKSLGDAGMKLEKVEIGLGWKMNRSAGSADFDLDVSMGFLNVQGTCAEKDFLFYNTPNLTLGYATHSGDNLVGGSGTNDDEMIEVDVHRIPSNIEKAEIFVTIHEADIRRQNFGMIDAAFVEIRDGLTKQVITRLDLDFDADVNTAIKFGGLQRRNNEWYFVAQKEGVTGGLGGIVTRLGMQV